MSGNKQRTKEKEKDKEWDRWMKGRNIEDSKKEPNLPVLFSVSAQERLEPSSVPCHFL
jgi:hypothetical protein